MLYALLQSIGVEPYPLGHPRRQEGRSPLWSGLRARYLAANPACVITGERNPKRLEIHHVKPVARFPELELVWDNLATLRDDVHLLVGHCGNWALWNQDFWACVAQLARAWQQARERA